MPIEALIHKWHSLLKLDGILLKYSLKTDGDVDLNVF